MRARVRETGRRDWICSACALESAALINASVYPSAPHGLISSMISTHPSPPPPCAIPHPILFLYLTQREERGRTEMKRAGRNKVRGEPQGAEQMHKTGVC